MIRVGILIFLICTSSAFAQGWPIKDPVIDKSKGIMDRALKACSNISNADRFACIDGFADPLRAALKSALSSQIRDAEQWAKQQQSFDPEGAKKGLQERKADIEAAQSTWEAYTKQQCHAVVNRYEIMGGTGGAGDMAECSLRHLLIRLHELRH